MSLQSRFCRCETSFLSFFLSFFLSAPKACKSKVVTEKNTFAAANQCLSFLPPSGHRLLSVVATTFGELQLQNFVALKCTFAALNVVDLDDVRTRGTGS